MKSVQMVLAFLLLIGINQSVSSQSATICGEARIGPISGKNVIGPDFQSGQLVQFCVTVNLAASNDLFPKNPSRSSFAGAGLTCEFWVGENTYIRFDDGGRMAINDSNPDFKVDFDQVALLYADKSLAMSNSQAPLERAVIEFIGDPMTFSGDQPDVVIMIAEQIVTDGLASGTVVFDFEGTSRAQASVLRDTVTVEVEEKPDDRLYGFDNLKQRMLSVDLTTGAASVLGEIGFSNLTALAYDPNKGVVYGYDSTATRLIEIDLENLSATAVGPFGAGAVVGLAFDSDANILYGLQGPQQNLLIFDVLDGSSTVVGNHGVQGLSRLAYDAQSQKLFSFDDINDELVQICPKTANVIYVGPTGDRIFALTFSQSSDSLVAIEPIMDELVFVDRDNGSISKVIGGTNLNGVWTLVAIPQKQFKLGDINGDGLVNLLDILPFVDLLSSGSYLKQADINQDGFVNLLDIDPFIQLL